MDNIQTIPSSESRRQLKAAPLMQHDYYTQIDCLPGPCVAAFDSESGAGRSEQIQQYYGQHQSHADESVRLADRRELAREIPTEYHKTMKQSKARLDLRLYTFIKPLLS
jgi:hypothetical protein